MAKEENKQNIVAKKGKVLTGIVVSDKMKDTVVVEVQSYTKHPRYGKYIRSEKRYKVHDEGNLCKVGERVTIRETRPISKHKSFIVVRA